jgi:hypothetical protein
MSATSKTAKGGHDLTGSDRIHDAEGVRPREGDKFEMVVVGDGTRRFGRVLEVRHTGDSFRPATVVVVWADDNRLGTVGPRMFEDYCRIV